MPSNWLNKILSHQVTPPEGVWMNIANELDNEDENISKELKTKMLAYETTPPAEVLGNIFNELEKAEKQLTPAFAERIYNYKEEAPVNTWKNISKELDKSESKIIPLNNRKTGKAIYFRMAAAASVIAIIATTIWLSTIKKNDVEPQTAAVMPIGKQTVTPNADKEKTTLPAADTRGKNAAKENVILSLGKEKTTTQNVNAYVKGNQVEDLAQNPKNIHNEKLQNANGETPMDIALLNTPNTYISITGPDGQAIKVSSKFSNLIGYLTGKNNDTQENLDIIIEESAKWKKIFASWRDKMTNNSVAPSVSNFMDIIALSEILEEKK